MSDRLLEILEEQRTAEVRTLDAALAAILAAARAHNEWVDTMHAWMRFERDPVTRKRLVHGNTMKAAERRADRASDAAISALHAASTYVRGLSFDWTKPETQQHVLDARADAQARLDNRATEGHTVTNTTAAAAAESES